MASEKKKFCGGYGYMGNHNLMKCEDSEMVCVIYRGLDRGGISCLKK